MLVQRIRQVTNLRTSKVRTEYEYPDFTPHQRFTSAAGNVAGVRGSKLHNGTPGERGGLQEHRLALGMQL